MPVPYPIALENVEPRYPWSWSHILLSSSSGSAVKRTLSFWTLLCGEDNGTQTCTAVMDRRHRFWINDIRDGPEYAFDEAIRNPMDNGLTNQSPLPTPSITIDSTFGVPMMSSKMKITVIKKIFFCVNHVFWVIFMFQRIVVLQFCGFILIWTHAAPFENFTFY